MKSHYQISEEELISKDRNRTLVEARHLIFWYLLKFTNTLPTIAGRCVNRFPSTAIHGRKTIDNKLTYDKDLQNIVRFLFNKKGEL